MNKKFLFLPLLLMALAVMAEPKLTIVDLNGQEQQFALSQLGKIVFEDNVMYLYGDDGTLLGSTNAENVGQIAVEGMEESAMSLTETNAANKIYVFPNPAQDALMVKGLPANQTVRVYDLQGKLMSATVTQAESTQINVSGLQNGTYLLQIGAQVVKFIKE